MSNLIGKRVRLSRTMDDPNPILAGDEGVVKLIDGLGQIHVVWDSGRSIAIIPELDKFEIL